MRKVLNPYNILPWGKKGQVSVFVKVEYEDGVLSLTGVEGPLSDGNCSGACGQIDMGFDIEDISSFGDGWNEEMVLKLMSIWSRWHLNDMHAECEHQESKGIKYSDDPNNVCDICGYKIGSAWTFREVPQDIINWLFTLPKCNKRPAWI